ncbi:MAG: hypothetical protein D6B26_04045, partial [Spirochaetaceae bacterium]
MPSRIPSAWLCLAYTLLLMLFLFIQPAGSLPGRALYQTLSYALLLYMFHRHTRDIQRKEDKPKGKPLSTILLTLFLLIIVPAISWLLLKLAYTL